MAEKTRPGYRFAVNTGAMKTPFYAAIALTCAACASQPNSTTGDAAADSPAEITTADVTVDTPLDASAVTDALDSATAIDAPTDNGLINIPDGTPVHALQAAFPAVPLDPGAETTLCVQIPLDNATPQLVRHGHIHLAPGSHHLIVYRMRAGSPTWTDPQPCGAFSGVTDGAPAMMMAQAADSDLVFPDGVALEIDAHQIVRLEQHFINLTGAPIQGTGTLTLDSIDPIDGVVRANMFFWGGLGIDIAPHSMGTLDYFHRVDPDVHVFALSTHQHHLGTLATLTRVPDATSPGLELYRNSDWAEPPIQQYSPSIAFNGDDGVRLHCEWFNTTDTRVQFGESASTDEMCFVGGYYYPSHGFDYCADDFCGTQ